MNHPPRAVPATTIVTSEAQLKWALVTSRQRAQAARDRIRQLYGDRNEENENSNDNDEQRTQAMNRGSNRLDDSQCEYSERKQWIEQHGYRHECSYSQGGDDDNDDDNEERSRRRRRMNESWYGRRFVIKQHQPARWNDASFPSPAAWRKGGGRRRRDSEPDDDPGRVERFQMAFAAAVAAIEKNQVVHPFPPSRFDSTSTTSFSKSTFADETPHSSHAPKTPHFDGTPKTRNSIVWTPQLREQVTSAAKSVLRQPHTKNRQEDDDDNDHDDDDDEVDFFVRQFERFMLQPDDNSLTSHESCLVEEVQPPSSTSNGWNNASSIVHEDETSTWTVDDSMSTIPPPEEDIVESTLQQEIYSCEEVPDNNTVIITVADIPSRVVSSDSSTPPPLAKERPQNHVAVPTAAPPNRLVPALPDDKIPFDWSCSSIRPKPLAPPSRIIATTTMTTAVSSSSSSSSAGCGLSVVRGASVPNNMVSSHYHCSAHWERQMML
jgi:hypothetical protein